MPYRYYDGGVVEVARGRPQLYYVACFQFVQLRLFGERPLALVVRQKVIKVFNASPGGRPVVYIYVVPPESRRKIHYRRARVYALRGEVCAVSADSVEVIIARVAPERPHSGVFKRRPSVVFKSFHINIL